MTEDRKPPRRDGPIGEGLAAHDLVNMLRRSAEREEELQARVKELEAELAHARQYSTTDWVILRAAERDEALARVAALEGALRDVFDLMEEGFLVRDISKDADPLWVLNSLRFVTRLKEAHAALSAHLRDNGPPAPTGKEGAE